MTRQDLPETDAKPARSYSLASAPLRLLSHSFHSTANAHNASTSTSTSTSTSNSIAPSATLAQLPSENSRTASLDTSKESIIADPYNQLYNAALDHPLGSEPHQYSLEQDTQHHHNPPQQNSVPSRSHPYHQKHHQQSLQQRFLESFDLGRITELRPGSLSLHESIPPRKKVIVDLHSHEEATERATTVTESSSSSVAVVPLQATDGKARLERLFLPYDIRYSVFGHLSLHDIYNCQLTCRLLHWATSDQFIWKRIALNLIQGEFYFDIPRALPSTLPNWKFFCKRHLLRQRNWRRGHVQDVISLDDDYKKLTTLQIMAPYVLTGCDDGRVHLWNIHTRTLLNRFQIRGEITWVEHLQEAKIVAGLGYDKENMSSEIRLFSTETGKEIGFYKQEFWDLAICAINGTYLVASDGDGRYTTWKWRTGTKVCDYTVVNETSITEALYLVGDTTLELHYDGLIRLFSIHGECYGRFTLDNILPNHQVSFCWLHNDYSMVVWESSNTMAHIRLPFLEQNRYTSGFRSGSGSGSMSGSESSDQMTQAQRRRPNPLDHPISQEEWDAQGAEVYWRHRLEHKCNFAAMGGGRFQLLYVQIMENLMDQVPIRVHSLRHSGSIIGGTNTIIDVTHNSGGGGGGTDVAMQVQEQEQEQEQDQGNEDDDDDERQHGEYVTAHSVKPELEKIIQGLRPSRIDCDPEFIVVGLVRGGVRLLQFAPVDEELFEQQALISTKGELND